MTSQRIFETSFPQLFGYLFSFTGPQTEELDMIRLEPIGEEGGTRCVALNGYELAAFDDQFQVWEPVNIYMDKEVAKEAKKKKWNRAKITLDEENNSYFILADGSVDMAFSVKLEKNGPFPSLEPILDACQKTAVETISLKPESLKKFMFDPQDTLHFTFSGDLGPVVIKSSKYETFWGVMMPVQPEADWSEYEDVDD